MWSSRLLRMFVPRKDDPRRPIRVARGEAIRNEDVRALVMKLLKQRDFPGRCELLLQVRELEYVAGPVTMMDLRVDRRCRPSSARSPVPNQPTVLDEDGEPVGGLLLWLDAEGYIDCLEYYWFEGDPPTHPPRSHQVTES